MGSSPRMRGTLIVCYDYDPHGGIIPAYAGNTPVWCHKECRAPDHPRICGEHSWRLSWRCHEPGSSPHMRGTPVSVDENTVGIGIIPAYAGNTCRYIRRWFSARDHPRICGEHKFTDDTARNAWGSSPHMRGTRGVRRHRKHDAGIIPAYAGNTVVVWRGLSLRRDHPRICGEHKRHCIVRKRCAGSSPHMRGTLTIMLSVVGLVGIIPAYAGNTHDGATV